VKKITKARKTTLNFFVASKKCFITENSVKNGHMPQIDEIREN